MKVLIYVTNRIYLILGIYVISILGAATIFSYVENKSFMDSIWWASVTSLTIGYGDISPVTFTGRMIGIVFGHFWIFLIIPMIVANIITNILVDINEFTDSEQKQLFNMVSRIEGILSENSKSDGDVQDSDKSTP